MQNGGRRIKITLGIPMLFAPRSLLRFLLLAGLTICPSLFVLAQENETAPLVSPPPPQATASVSPLTSSGSMSAASPSPSASPTPVVLNDLLFKGVKARNIGPALMGGRVSDIAIDPRNPAIFYVGLGTGGIFKSGNNGVSFDPI